MSGNSQRTVSTGRALARTKSTGRGGAGNMRPPSEFIGDRFSGVSNGPEDYSRSGGREVPAPKREKLVAFGSGRGGIGNLYTPTHTATVESLDALREEAKYVREHASKEIPASHGRGGAGNFAITEPTTRHRAREGRSQLSEASANAPRETREAKKTPAAPALVSDAVTPRNHKKRGVKRIAKLFRFGSRGVPKTIPEVSER